MADSNKSGTAESILSSSLVLRDGDFFRTDLSLKSMNPIYILIFKLRPVDLATIVRT